MSSSVRIFAVAGTLLAWGLGLACEAEARSFRLYDMEAALAEPYPLDVRPKYGASRMPSTVPPARQAIAPRRPAPAASAPARAPVLPEPKAAVPPSPPVATGPGTGPAKAPPATASAMPAPGTAIPPSGSSAAGSRAQPPTSTQVTAPPPARQPAATPKPPRRPVTTAQRRARPVRGTQHTGSRLDGWYVTAAGGGGFPMDADNSSSTIEIESSYDFGFLFTGGGGYAWRNGFRADAELLYATYDLDQVSVTRATGLGVATGSRDAEGDLSVLALMANGAYDFDLGMAWRPNVLAGAGIAQVSLNDVTAGGAIVDDEAFVMAFQAGLGVNYALTDNWSLELGYRFFSTLEPELDDAAGNPFDSQVATHNLLFGGRYRF